jgi:hypothetical protein
MANIRYFNLKALNNVKIKNFDTGANVRRVFDPGNGFTNFGILTEGNTNFPHHVHGAGVQGTMLTNSFDTTRGLARPTPRSLLLPTS